MNVLPMNGAKILCGHDNVPVQYRWNMVRKGSIEDQEPVVGRTRGLTVIENQNSVVGRTRGRTKPQLRVRIPVTVPEKSSHKRCPIHIGKMYELDDGRYGICMFLGRTLFNKKGLWVGLQLENAEGKHNGTVYGKKYFLCREGKGVFVRPCRIKRLITEVSKSNINPLDKKVMKCPRRNAYIRKQTIMDLVKLTTPSLSARELIELERRETHRQMLRQQSTEDKPEVSGWVPAEYDIKPNHELIFKPKTLYTEKVLHSKYGEETERNRRVSEITEEGYPSEWEEASFSVASDLTDHGGLFYPRSKLHKHLNEKAAHKPGAIETGVAKNYEKPQYPGRQYSIEKEQYFLHYPKSKLHVNDGEQAERKPGAIEIGKSDYETAQYDIDTSIEKRQYALYHSMHELHKRDGEQTPHKEWAMEIGRANSFRQAMYSVDWDPITLRQYGLYYNAKDLEKNWKNRIRADSTVSSIQEGERYDEDMDGRWSRFSVTPGLEQLRSPTFSGQWRTNTGQESLQLLSAATPATDERNSHPEGVTSVTSDILKVSETVTQDEGESLQEDADENDIDDYLPRRFSSHGSVKDDVIEYLPKSYSLHEEAAKEDVTDYLPQRFLQRKVPKTNMIGPDDIYRRHQSFDVSSNYHKVNFRHKPTEEDLFMKDMMSLARNKFGERQQKARSRSRTQSLVNAPWYQEITTIVEDKTML